MKHRLHVLEVFEPPDGGVAEHVRLLAGGLAARGHAVAVAGRPDARPRRWLESQGVPYEPLPLTGRVPDPGRDVRAARSLFAMLRAGHYDVVHAHGQKAGILARIAARRCGVPSVYTPHSFVHRTQMLRPRRTAWLRFQAGLRVERALGRWTAALVAVAEDERQAALSDRILPPERIAVVHPGIDVDVDCTPNEALARFRGTATLLGFVAGLRAQKGIETLLDALEIVAANGEELRFAIVGNGPLRDYAAARVKTSALADRTLLMPFDGKVEPYLSCLDAFVLPSLWEGLPMAVLEAMAMGLPVVATDVNGIPEAVEEGVTGYLVPPMDPAALADRMLLVAGDKRRRHRMGEAARRVAQDKFGADRMVEELAALYFAVRDERPPGAIGT